MAKARHIHSKLEKIYMPTTILNLSKDFRWHGPLPEHHMTYAQVALHTLPHTDLWQRTYYNFRNDNAPMLLTSTREKYFTFSVRTEFLTRHRFDQCGVVVYLNSDNWLKASAEYQNMVTQQLGSVVTNLGYSDWATSAVDASINVIWYRLSRRENDFRLESSLDGQSFLQMRVCHLWEAKDEIRFGVYACSPEDSSFPASFSNFELTDCQWAPHDGQPPDVGIEAN